MPMKKKNNKKNAPVEKRNSSLVPKKEDAGRVRATKKTLDKVSDTRITALSTVGKKKKPK